MKVLSSFSTVPAQRASKPVSADVSTQPKDTPPGPTFEEFYAPQRRKELMVAAIPVYGAYHNVSHAATNLLGFGTGGGYRMTAALCNLAGTVGLCLGHPVAGIAGLAASSGFTYLHQTRG